MDVLLAWAGKLTRLKPWGGREKILGFAGLSRAGVEIQGNSGEGWGNIILFNDFSANFTTETFSLLIIENNKHVKRNRERWFGMGKRVFLGASNM